MNKSMKGHDLQLLYKPSRESKEPLKQSVVLWNMKLLQKFPSG